MDKLKIKSAAIEQQEPGFYIEVLNLHTGEFQTSHKFYYEYTAENLSLVEDTLIPVLQNLPNVNRKKNPYTEDIAKVLSEKTATDYDTVFNFLDDIVISDSRFDDEHAKFDGFKVIVVEPGENYVPSVKAKTPKV